MISSRCLGHCLGGLALLACANNATGNGPPPGTDSLALIPVAQSLTNPVYLAAPPGDVNRLFVVEQPGRIRVVQNGTLLQAPFLDIANRVSYGGEQGLFSVAFHPSYASNGFFYVDYTDVNGDTRVERYSVSADSNVADSATHTLILFVAQPYPNHNGGLVMFGPDGMFYIGMGDGGSGGDPQNRAQNPDSLLGKLLRIDVNTGTATPYNIPSGNRDARGGGRGEIWALGLRNPWRYSLDPPSGLLYTADVGQAMWEEWDVRTPTTPGSNNGWRIIEGQHCYNANPCSQTGLVLPAGEYDHSNGDCAVICVFIYLDAASPALAGPYFYSDECGEW